MDKSSVLGKCKLSYFCIEDKLLGLPDRYEFDGFILKTEILKNGEEKKPKCVEIKYDLILDFLRSDDSLERLSKAVRMEIALMPKLNPTKRISLVKTVKGNKYLLIKEMMPLVKKARAFNEKKNKQKEEKKFLFSK